MKFVCAKNLHWYNSEDKADNCQQCRRTLDSKVRRHFRNQSEQQLREAKRKELENDSF